MLVEVAAGVVDPPNEPKVVAGAFIKLPKPLALLVGVGDEPKPVVTGVVVCPNPEPNPPVVVLLVRELFTPNPELLLTDVVPKPDDGVAVEGFVVPKLNDPDPATGLDAAGAPKLNPCIESICGHSGSKVTLRRFMNSFPVVFFVERR